MSWFADLAGKAESLLNNLDEQTGQALRNHNRKQKIEANSETNWNQRRRPQFKGQRKTSVGETKSNFVTNAPTRRNSPTGQSRPKEQDIRVSVPKKKQAPRKTNQYHIHCPRAMVDGFEGDSVFVEQYPGKTRRHSLPSDLDSLSGEGWTLRMQNLEVENTMLKNELNVMNREVSDLLERVRKAEDDANKTHVKLDNAELENHRVNLDKEVLASQVEQLKMKINEVTVKKDHYCDVKARMNKEVMRLTEARKDLEEKITELQRQKHEITTAHQKLENEHRHAQTTINELQSDLNKTNAECHRLEKEWETYKLRVKNMLLAKDNEIRSLQTGLKQTEDTKVLMEQLETLKYERDELSEAIACVRNECANFKHYMGQVETKHEAAERVVAALRDALRDERSNKARIEAQYIAVAKELKFMQMETGQTIASLRTALRDKESELMHLRDTTSSVKTADTSALNVADYNVTQDKADSDKIQHLSETLFQRQAKIDRLMADNNMLRIQLDKLESKYKAEIGSIRANSHSVVNVTDCRQRRHGPDTMIQAISNRMAAVLKRYPSFRIFIVFYMVCLHFWVLTVLLTNTPENYIPHRPTRWS